MTLKKIAAGFTALLLLVSFSALALATPEDEAVLSYNLYELTLSSDMLNQEFTHLVSQLGASGATPEILTAMASLEYALSEEINKLKGYRDQALSLGLNAVASSFDDLIQADQNNHNYLKGFMDVVDPDRDGIHMAVDNCPLVYNPDQKDTNNDGVGDACEVAPPSTNQKPVLASIGDKTVKEGKLLEFTVSAADADNDTLTFTAENLPAGAVFSSQKFSWTPDYTQSGEYLINFRVSDGKDAVSETVKVTVTKVSEEELKVIALENKFKKYDDKFNDLEEEYLDARDDKDQREMDYLAGKLESLYDDLKTLDSDAKKLKRSVDEHNLEDRLDDLREDIKELMDDIDKLLNRTSSTGDESSIVYSTPGVAYSTPSTAPSAPVAAEEPVEVKYFQFPAAAEQKADLGWNWEDYRWYAWISAGILVLLVAIILLLRALFF